MTTGRYSRRQPAKKSPPFPVPAASGPLSLGVVLAASLVLHLVVGTIVLRGVNLGRFERTPPATLYVDLVAAPALAPKRSAGATVEPLAVKPETPVVKSVVPPVTKRHNEVVVAAKEKQPQKPKPKTDDEGDIRKSLAEMRQRQKEKEELVKANDAIAQMRNKAQVPQTKTTASSKPAAGTPDSNGTEAGSGIEAWLRQALHENWQLSQYQIDRRDLQARVEIELDAQGKLTNYKFVESSKDQAFNDSLRRAIIKLKPLPKELRKPWRDTILFTLDDLQGD